ncbi:acetyltransferase, GNAT family protein [Toxoplasma gondii GT1]|uniref:Acetyltransferase, GNAT family protein n=6 Tax=Toxoplasma gondii TaxID=5811 RepID=S7VU95_TOXGG|nr:acetyltransferase, GNAT family protein [Toxoplasma gondii GT1]KAF4645533.1 acetyltransferase, GNAT family protein [Toxoplasma gondii]KFG47289.1 acetyltransferase, GNAT family protein [Toxoplasma gondii FOU]PIL98774.1 acetyltransferase, GNAT family protein [Toxoplasma gondii COUG]PUA87621.1 acetyltransferase, GNAT family protein [Toxoplasma gondii TgCATBr9]RQX75007.1 acetyltransferase, GNAT family protein [Toxoplasma gondii CAST]
MLLATASAVLRQEGPVGSATESEESLGRALRSFGFPGVREEEKKDVGLASVAAAFFSAVSCLTEQGRPSEAQHVAETDDTARESEKNEQKGGQKEKEKGVEAGENGERVGEGEGGGKEREGRERQDSRNVFEDSETHPAPQEGSVSATQRPRSRKSLESKREAFAFSEERAMDKGDCRTATREDEKNEGEEKNEREEKKERRVAAERDFKGERGAKGGHVGEETEEPAEVHGECQVSSFPLCKDTVVVDDVTGRLHEPAMKKLLEDSDALSLRVFDQKCLEVTSKKKKWRLRILTDSRVAASRRCLGFIVYRVDVGLQALQVGKVAVLEECRGRGYGRKLVKGIIQVAKSNRSLTSINLSAYTSAVGFYTVLGFKRHDDIPLAEDGELSAPQVYMEMQLRKRACVAGQSRKRK